MPDIPCPVSIKCPGGPQGINTLDADSPVSNFSSEDPDRILFGATGYPIWNPDNPINSIPPNDPSLPPAWFAQGCIAPCYSPSSQADAIACAIRQAWQCQQSKRTPAPQEFLNAQQQCTFTCPDGTPFVWTVAAGYVVAGNQELADRIAQEIACQQAAAHFICLPSSLPGTCIGANYLQTITVSAGPLATRPIIFTVTMGALPPGLFLFGVADNAAQIIGTPTTPGSFSFVLRATDANGNFAEKTYTLGVLGITNIGAVPDGVENTAYSFQLNAAGGTGPFTFALASGSLDGMTLSSSGLISGTPAYATANTFNFTVAVRDSTGAVCSAAGTLKVNLRPGPDWTQLTWPFYGVVQNPPNFTASGSASRNTGNGALDNKQIGFLSEISPAGSSIIKYTGPAVTCRCRVIITASSGNTQIALVATINGVGGNITNLANKPPGTYDFDFNSGALVNGSLNIEGGINDIDPSNNILAFLGGIGSLAFSFVIFNV